MDNYYRRILGLFMKHRWLSFGIIALCLAAILFFGSSLKSELAPLEDHSNIRTSITAPEGTGFYFMRDLVSRIAQTVMDSVPEARLVFCGTAMGMSNNTNTGSINTFLVEPEERQASQQDIYDRLSRIYRKFSAARIIPNQEQTISTSLAAGSQLPVQFILQNLEFEKLQHYLPKFLEEARNDSTFANVDANLKFNKPELDIYVNRQKATNLGINIQDISNTLQFALSGGRYDYFLHNGKQYMVIGQIDREDRSKPADIASLYVRSNTGNLIQLDNLVTIQESSNPPTRYHFNRYKSATVSASLAKGKTLGEGIAAMRRVADKVLDDSFNTDLFGPSRDFSESNSNTMFAFVLALLLIYLILSAQFESFREPFIIMLTVPFAIAGALFSLWVFEQTLNIFSQIGMIMLIGLVTKNGILIVEFANQKRKSGLSKREAVFEAAAARLRPILMTSLATIFGALPIALGLGAGASSRIPLGIVVVGGLFFALILTLFVVPVMYSLIAKDSARGVTIEKP